MLQWVTPCLQGSVGELVRGLVSIYSQSLPLGKVHRRVITVSEWAALTVFLRLFLVSVGSALPS